jgi:DNA polymerase III sliding clamp (beta) subunit (PCNA family)
MIITANRLELLSAAQDAEQIAPTSSPLDVLQCTSLRTEDGKLTVTATNVELTLERRIPADIFEEGSVVIDAGLLVKMLRLLESETVTVEQTSNVVATVKGGSATYSIITFDAGMYPQMEIPFPEDTVPVTGIPAMAKRTVFAVSEDENKPQMKCVHLIFSSDGLHAVGSDGLQIAAARGDSKAVGAVDMLIPATSLAKLARLVSNKDTLRVGTTGKDVVFFKDDFAFSARLIEGNYFDADQLLGRVHPSFTILTDADQLKYCLSSVYSVTGSQNRFSVSFSGTRLQMRCESEYGASVSGMDVVPLSGAPTGVYWYNPAKLMGCLRAQNGTLILGVAQNGALQLQTDDLICLLMATREPKPIELKQPVRKAEAEPKPKAKTEKKKKKNEDAALPAAA